MIHYSCDRCRRTIDPDEEVRYSVKIEIHAAIDAEDSDEDDDRDHLIELQDILERLDDSECEEISQSAYQRRRFDLCHECHRRYAKNPLSMDASTKLEFSDN